MIFADAGFTRAAWRVPRLLLLMTTKQASQNRQLERRYLRADNTHCLTTPEHAILARYALSRDADQDAIDEESVSIAPTSS
jgi:hypothetical protein